MALPIDSFILKVTTTANIINLQTLLMSQAVITSKIGPCPPVYCNCSCNKPSDTCWFAILDEDTCPIEVGANVIIIPNLSNTTEYDTDIPVFSTNLISFMGDIVTLEIIDNNNEFSGFDRYAVAIFVLACSFMFMFVIIIYRHMTRENRQNLQNPETRTNERTPLIAMTDHIYKSETTETIGTIEMGVEAPVSDEKVNDTHKLCIICISEYVENDPLKELRCLHRYHTKCITPWLESHNNCPLCREQQIKT